MLVVEARIKPEDLTIVNILQDLAKALQVEYGNEAKIDVQPHSVGIFFGSKQEFSIDVVPAQPAADGLYWVPESALRSVRSRRALYESKPTPGLRWIKSDPQGYINQATTLDNATNGVFRKAAKFIKKWNRGCKNDDEMFPLKSFHLEIVVTELLKKNRALSCLDLVGRLFPLLSALITRPQYVDKADSTRYIDAYVSALSIGERALVAEEQKRAITFIGQMNAAGSEAKVLLAIEELLRLATRENEENPAITSTPRVSPAYSKPYRG
jgi:hypothetical protein